ncbi:MAG: nuclease-related domain-containing protein [Planctomycetota bacterium]
MARLTAHTKLAGRYPKQRIVRVADKQILLVLTLALVVGGFVGVTSTLGFVWRSLGFGILGLIAVLSATICVWLVRRPLVQRIEREMTSLARQRTAMELGGRGEALVSTQLRRLSSQWHLFDGVPLKTGGDVDHVLVGPRGIFAISTKAQRGLVQIRDNSTCTINGHTEQHPNEVIRQALSLHQELLIGADVRLFVHPVLCFAFAHVDDQRTETPPLVVGDVDGVAALFTAIEDTDSRKKTRFAKDKKLDRKTLMLIITRLRAMVGEDHLTEKDFVLKDDKPGSDETLVG